MMHLKGLRVLTYAEIDCTCRLYFYSERDRTDPIYQNISISFTHLFILQIEKNLSLYTM